MFWPFSRRAIPPPQDTTRDALSSAEDTALITRARQRDAGAFGILYQRHLERVYRYIAYRTIQQDVAEDLTSEVFLNAWKSIERYEDRGYTFRSWLLRLAHNEVVDYYRVRKTDVPLPEQESQMPALAGPELLAELQSDRAALLRAIRQLPDEWQQLILLRFVEELSFDEIASVLGKSSGACRQLQHRIFARLRELLAAEEAFRES
jgi:RNA polymerase sigma-70 factor, ECF subfamily